MAGALVIGHTLPQLSTCCLLPWAISVHSQTLLSCPRIPEHMGCQIAQVSLKVAENVMVGEGPFLCPHSEGQSLCWGRALGLEAEVGKAERKLQQGKQSQQALLALLGVRLHTSRS